jgi:hypothetical protein
LPKAEAIAAGPETAYVIAHCSPLLGLRGRSDAEEWTLVLGRGDDDNADLLKLHFTKVLCAPDWEPKADGSGLLYGPATDDRTKTFLLVRSLPPGSYRLRALGYTGYSGTWRFRTRLEGQLDLQPGEVRYIGSFRFTLGRHVDVDWRLTGRTDEYSARATVLDNLPALLEALNLGSPGLGDALSQRDIAGPLVTALPEPPPPGTAPE